MKMKRIGIWVAMSIYILSLYGQAGYQSKVITDTIYSEVLKAKRAYTVYLPKSLNRIKKKGIRFSISCMVCGKRMMCGQIVDM